MILGKIIREAISRLGFVREKVSRESLLPVYEILISFLSEVNFLSLRTLMCIRRKEAFNLS